MTVVLLLLLFVVAVVLLQLSGEDGLLVLGGEKFGVPLSRLFCGCIDDKYRFATAVLVAPEV